MTLPALDESPGSVDRLQSPEMKKLPAGRARLFSLHAIRLFEIIKARHIVARRTMIPHHRLTSNLALFLQTFFVCYRLLP